MKRTSDYAFGGFILFVLLIYILGLGWGLPSRERTERVSGSLEFSNDAKKAWLDSRRFDGAPIEQYIAENLELNSQGGIFDNPRFYSMVRPFFTRSVLPDEPHTLAALGNMDPARLDFNPSEHKYGAVFIYSLAVFIYIGKLFGLYALTGDITYYYSHPEQMARIYMAGRSLACLMGFLCSLALWRTIAPRWGKSMAWMSAIIFLFMPPVFFYSHVLKPHIFALFWGILVIETGMRMVESGSDAKSKRNYIIGGILSGAAMATALNYAIVWLAIWIAHMMNTQWRLRSIMDKRLWASGLLVQVSYLVCTPYFFFSLPEFFYEFSRHTGKSGYSYGFFRTDKIYSGIEEFFWFACGPLLAVLIAAGILLVMRRNYQNQCPRISGMLKRLLLTGAVDRRLQYLWLVLLSLFIILTGLFGQLRFAILCLPILAFYAAYAVCTAWTSIPSLRWIFPLVLAISLSASLIEMSNYIWDTNSSQMADYIQDHIPEGDRIATDFPLALDSIPALRFDRYNYISVPCGELMNTEQMQEADWIIRRSSFIDQTDEYFLKHFQLVHSVHRYSLFLSKEYFRLLGYEMGIPNETFLLYKRKSMDSIP